MKSKMNILNSRLTKMEHGLRNHVMELEMLCACLNQVWKLYFLAQKKSLLDRIEKIFFPYN